jgi:molybdopterin-binding protein
MRISDANKLVGRIREVKTGQDMSEVLIDIGDQMVTATITKAAAEDLKLKKNDQVFATFNSSNVNIIKNEF